MLITVDSQVKRTSLLLVTLLRLTLQWFWPELYTQGWQRQCSIMAITLSTMVWGFSKVERCAHFVIAELFYIIVFFDIFNIKFFLYNRTFRSFYYYLELLDQVDTSYSHVPRVYLWSGQLSSQLARQVWSSTQKRSICFFFNIPLAWLAWRHCWPSSYIHIYTSIHISIYTYQYIYSHSYIYIHTIYIYVD